jgi:hypothetical protein
MDGDGRISYDEILGIVELVKSKENLVMDIEVDSFEPTIMIYRHGLIR